MNTGVGCVGSVYGMMQCKGLSRRVVNVVNRETEFDMCNVVHRPGTSTIVTCRDGDVTVGQQQKQQLLSAGGPYDVSRVIDHVTSLSDACA